MCFASLGSMDCLYIHTCTCRHICPSCGRPTLNVIERFGLGLLRSDTAKPFHLVSLRRKHRMYTDYVAGLAWMWSIRKSDFCFETKVSFCQVFCLLWRRANAPNVSQINLYGVQHIQINLTSIYSLVVPLCHVLCLMTGQLKK